MPHRVAILAFEGCQSLDVLGPLEVLHGATTFLSSDSRSSLGYEVSVVGFAEGPVRTESGARLHVDWDLSDTERRALPLDTLLLAGGEGVRSLVADPGSLSRVRELATRAGRLGSICTGAFLLGAMGLLDGRRATTHWAYSELFAAAFPEVQLESDPIFVRDGSVWTSAGVTSGIDLALAMVEEDLDAQVAASVAKQLVVFLRRSGSEAQLSEPLRLQTQGQPGVRELATWLAANPTENVSLQVLSRRCGMSVRNFTRTFREQVGTSPSRFVERVRSDRARSLLESSNYSVEEVAAAAGFANATALRRAFVRHHGVTPARYRRG